MNIRVACKEDLGAIHLIYNQAVDERFCTAHTNKVSRAYMLSWFEGHDPSLYPVFVAEEGGEILGWVSLGPYRGDREALRHVAEVSYYVHRACREKGIGSLLLGHAIGEAPSRGISVLVAILLNKNPASTGILKKFGFVQWGCMPGIALIGEEETDHLYYGRKL